MGFQSPFSVSPPPTMLNTALPVSWSPSHSLSLLALLYSSPVCSTTFLNINNNFLRVFSFPYTYAT